MLQNILGNLHGIQIPLIFNSFIFHLLNVLKLRYVSQTLYSISYFDSEVICFLGEKNLSNMNHMIS